MASDQKKTTLFDETGLTSGTAYKKGQWLEIVTHDENNICGFFGEYRFLSNFYPAAVVLDGIVYPTVENAYKAAKYPSDMRAYFVTCTPKEAIRYERATVDGRMDPHRWDICKRGIMFALVAQKFSRVQNNPLFEQLLATGSKYLEETNWWGDTYWGVHKTSRSDKGVGENVLGKILTCVRNNARVH